jgi:hypothetical protein
MVLSGLSACGSSRPDGARDCSAMQGLVINGLLGDGPRPGPPGEAQACHAVRTRIAVRCDRAQALRLGCDGKLG